MRKVPYYLQMRDHLASQAEPLQVAAGTPGLYLTRTSYDQHDNVVEFDQEFWRYDVLEVAIEVRTEVVAAAPIVAALLP